jgi:hypothetical protein
VRDKELKGTFLQPHSSVKVYNVIIDPTNGANGTIDPTIVFFDALSFKKSPLRARLIKLMLELDERKSLKLVKISK